MTLVRKAAPIAVLFALLALAVALLAPAGQVGAADHLDAPGLTPPSGRIDLDINDVYAFTGAPGTTVLAMTVFPLADTDSRFSDEEDGVYEFRVDTNADARTNISYVVEFDDNGTEVTVRRATGRSGEGVWNNGKKLGRGDVGEVITLNDGTKLFTGLRSDPFFFDLSGFRGTVEGVGDDALGMDPTDFFVDLNTLAIVLEIPDSKLNSGGPIAVWGRTSDGNGKQVDRMGRPAINTVFNSSGPIVGTRSNAKNQFNATRPVGDVLKWTDEVVNGLLKFSALDTEGAYSDDQAAALAAVLLPDQLPFDKASTLPAPLNGRALADDVIDVELRVTTGGDPLDLFMDRDADGGVNSDGVGPHDDYLTMFPYLGVPHS
jgi:Domain of unknown function (DUF4331)